MAFYDPTAGEIPMVPTINPGFGTVPFGPGGSNVGLEASASENHRLRTPLNIQSAVDKYETLARVNTQDLQPDFRNWGKDILGAKFGSSFRRSPIFTIDNITNTLGDKGREKFIFLPGVNALLNGKGCGEGSATNNNTRLNLAAVIPAYDLDPVFFNKCRQDARHVWNETNFLGGLHDVSVPGMVSYNMREVDLRNEWDLTEEQIKGGMPFGYAALSNQQEVVVVPFVYGETRWQIYVPYKPANLTSCCVLVIGHVHNAPDEREKPEHTKLAPFDMQYNFQLHYFKAYLEFTMESEVINPKRVYVPNKFTEMELTGLAGL